MRGGGGERGERRIEHGEMKSEERRSRREVQGVGIEIEEMRGGEDSKRRG